MESKTNADGERDRAEAERRVWEDFRAKLAAAQTYLDALTLVAEGAPPPESPGRRYYANLGTFLQLFQVPVRSSHAEKELYLEFIERLDAAGQLKPGVREQLEGALRRAMSAQGN
jgi:hypothetical protein